MAALYWATITGMGLPREGHNGGLLRVLQSCADSGINEVGVLSTAKARIFENPSNEFIDMSSLEN